MLIKFALNQITAREEEQRCFCPKSPLAGHVCVHVCVCVFGVTLDRVQFVAEGFIIFDRG